MRETGWHNGDQFPVRDGWFKRDHRECCEYLDEKDRVICFDYFMPVLNPSDPLYPGVWYVPSERITSYVQLHLISVTSPDALYRGLNDASRQDLPWCGVQK
jgi:hypothetical protein